jgi:hypothetical protein
VDRTILIHKIEASKSQSDAQIVLIGDSSCLMDVAAGQLTEQLQRPVLNLGTLSYVDLSSHAALLRQFVRANPNQVKAVVLLMHPQALRLPAPEDYHMKFLDRYLAGEDPPHPPNTARVSEILGLEIFRSRVLARVRPSPLPGRFGQRYGFTSDLERYLAGHRGSLVDPDPQTFEGNAEYRLALQLESVSRTLRAAVPQGTKLCVGITPVPAGFAGLEFPALRDQMLRQWSDWLRAEVSLIELPATLPDQLFAKTTHLNEPSVTDYTRLLGEALRPHLP